MKGVALFICRPRLGCLGMCELKWSKHAWAWAANIACPWVSMLPCNSDCVVCDLTSSKLGILACPWVSMLPCNSDCGVLSLPLGDSLLLGTCPTLAQGNFDSLMAAAMALDRLLPSSPECFRVPMVSLSHTWCSAGAGFARVDDEQNADDKPPSEEVSAPPCWAICGLLDFCPGKVWDAIVLTRREGSQPQHHLFVSGARRAEPGNLSQNGYGRGVI